MGAAGGDLAVAAVVAMLVWPFPLIRLTLGIPWSVHVPLILAWVLVVYAAYLATSVAIWGRTPVMYLTDLGLAGVPRPFGLGRSLRWALGLAVAVVPSLLGARSLADPRTGLAARASGLVTVASESVGG